MTKSVVIAVASIILSAGVASNPANATEVRFFHPGVTTGFVKTLVPQFENSSGHKVTTAAGTGGALTSRVRKGETADLVIVTTEQVEQLIAERKIVLGTQAAVASVGMGMGVRKGVAKPDISSVDALKRALLAATSIGYPDPAGGAPSGIHAAKMIAGLGLADELKSRIRLYGSGPQTAAALAKGEVELAFSQMTDLVGSDSIVVAGLLPPTFQNTTHLSGGVVAGSRQQDSARALLSFLTSPAAKAVLQQRGFR
jgi:molybdate transport system substrate-binding protein